MYTHISNEVASVIHDPCFIDHKVLCLLLINVFIAFLAKGNPGEHQTIKNIHLLLF